MSNWATEDRKVLLHFSAKALDTFSRYVQSEDSSCEAGGILLGSVHGFNMLVDEATSPTIHDKRRRSFFERMPFGHDSIALSRWVNSGGVIRYLGEWHTHPEGYPTPSNLDKLEWRRVAATRQDMRPILTTIVGIKGMYVGLGCTEAHQMEILLPMDN